MKPLEKAGYRLLFGEMPPPSQMTHAHFSEATRAAHLHMQRHEIGRDSVRRMRRLWLRLGTLTHR